jgi:hypothetical protein
MTLYDIRTVSLTIHQLNLTAEIQTIRPNNDIGTLQGENSPTNSSRIHYAHHSNDSRIFNSSLPSTLTAYTRQDIRRNPPVSDRRNGLLYKRSSAAQSN